MAPSHYFRSLAGKDRSLSGNRHLGFSLAFVAGAANAGGFLAVHQYTSHMSGIVSAIADNAALGDLVLVLSGVAALLSFATGAASSAILVNWGRRRGLQSQYASPLLVEAALLLAFGLLGSQLAAHRPLFAPLTVILLCFIMGLQNAMITKLSNAEIRTTHVTGMVTDIGIELGKLCYPKRAASAATLPPVAANLPRLRVLSVMLGMFFVGGILGAIGFKRFGYASTIPLAAILAVLAAVPLADDLRGRFRLR
ncbi:YoaK family protein [Burkholderia alba]|uniref:YoaK family protein n=1 Tax=Burkholderia alba TaxID=2683677 RepID=UPI002B053FBC|nr:YoaK family protein [Burkholderia alba]